MYTNNKIKSTASIKAITHRKWALNRQKEVSRNEKSIHRPTTMLLSFVLCICLLSGFLTGCEHHVPNERIPDDIVDSIETGMFLEDVVDLIGFEGKNIGSGLLIQQYTTKSGQTLQISYDTVPGFNYADTTYYHYYVVRAITLKPASTDNDVR